MTLPSWLLRIIEAVTGKPTPVAPPISPIPAVGPSDPVKAALFAKANAMRAAKGLPAFLYGPKLAESAQKGADDVVSGAVPASSPHGDFAGRIKSAGYPYAAAEGAAPTSQPGGLDGLDLMVSGGPGEPHNVDFYSRAHVRIGIGYATAGGSGWLFLDYGVR